ncbi:hypothetical protein ACFO0U_13070 [Chromohalobacter sarecensis]|uniref:RCK N-terminal domain-containing protein n=1 Tax=Chromohalobacter sarecensis TaxID=245294 RepID=A0ABV9D4K3_9GAMM|nr:hypothetical protein [Chromohalobacter sarecensis]MCK0715888.1 hypothetical protein [Chromohalobacter sarecensis]
MDWSQRRILITGADTPFAEVLIDWLLPRGALLWTLDENQTALERQVRGVPTRIHPIVASPSALQQRQQCQEIAARAGIEMLIHVRSPGSDDALNIEGALHVDIGLVTTSEARSRRPCVSRVREASRPDRLALSVAPSPRRARFSHLAPEDIPHVYHLAALHHATRRVIQAIERHHRPSLAARWRDYMHASQRRRAAVDGFNTF